MTNFDREILNLFLPTLGSKHNHYTNSGTYPPYEIVQKDDENFLIHLSVAGYKKGKPRS